MGRLVAVAEVVFGDLKPNAKKRVLERGGGGGLCARHVGGWGGGFGGDWAGARGGGYKILFWDIGTYMIPSVLAPDQKVGAASRLACIGHR